MELAINVIERAWRRLVAHRGADRLAADPIRAIETTRNLLPFDGRSSEPLASRREEILYGALQNASACGAGGRGVGYRVVVDDVWGRCRLRLSILAPGGTLSCQRLGHLRAG